MQHESFGHRPRLRYRWLGRGGLRRQPVCAGGLRCGVHRRGRAVRAPSGRGVCRHQRGDRAHPARGACHRKAVLPAQSDHGHRRGRSPRRDPAGGSAGRPAHLRVHPHAGKAGCYRLRQGREKAGAGNDPRAAASARRAKAGRYRRCTGYGDYLLHTNGNQLNRFVRRVAGPI